MRTIAVSVCALAMMFALAVPANAAIEQARLHVELEPLPTESVAPGAAILVSGKVVNQGPRSKRTRVRAFLRGPAGKVAIGSKKIRRVKKSRGFEIATVVPPGLAAGTYDLLACVRRHANRGRRTCSLGGDLAIAPVDPTVPPDDPTVPPDFTPGARTLNDPLLPQIGNGGYDARDYEIDLDFDPTANTFETAALTMRAVATQDLSQLSLDFQDLAVDGVTVDGVAAGFSQTAATPALAGGGTQPMKLVVDPASGIANGATFTVRVSYHGAPQVFTDPDGSDEGWIPSVSPASSYFVVGEPMGSQAWFPSNNHPSDKASFTTAITVPTGRTAIGVGELTGQDANGDGTTTWSWREESPTSTYLVTASNAATPVPTQYEESAITEALTGRTLPIYDTIATSAALSTPAITALTDRNAEMVDALGAHYGPYPLDSYGSFWDINPGIGYALEVQTKSHFSSVVGEGTYLHELAHQWWGNAVTLHDWNDLWFNEGWAQYSDWLFAFESGASADSPKDHFDDEYAGAAPGDWSTAPAVLDNDPAKMFSPSFPTYTRGAMTLAGFREIIGHAAFDQFARDLQTQFAHGSIDTPEFIAFAKAKSGFTGAELIKLDQYFQQWLYGTTKPTLTYADF